MAYVSIPDSEQGTPTSPHPGPPVASGASPPGETASNNRSSHRVTKNEMPADRQNPILDTMRAPIPRSLIVRSCGLLLIAFHTLGYAAVNNGQLLEQGQRAFDNGRFSQAAEQWQKALNSYRRQGDMEAVIRTSILLADGYQ